MKRPPARSPSPRKQSAPTRRLGLRGRMERVQLLLTDVDGVLTDGTVVITADGEHKQFSIQDGLGLIMWRKCGYKSGWISARPSAITTRRAQELHIDYLSQERTGKVAAAERMLGESGLTWADVCYVGDDVVDLCLLKRAGLAVAVHNAVEEAKELAHYVTTARGGHGAVREIITLILKAQGKWELLLRDYTE